MDEVLDHGRGRRIETGPIRHDGYPSAPPGQSGPNVRPGSGGVSRGNRLDGGVGPTRVSSYAEGKDGDGESREIFRERGERKGLLSEFKAGSGGDEG